MIRTCMLLFTAPVVFGIIVRDSPATISYNVQDPETGDSKVVHEVRDGDVVRGFYTVLDPDGTKRTVDYTADAQHGFKAVIRNEPVGLPHGVTQQSYGINYNENKNVLHTSIVNEVPRHPDKTWISSPTPPEDLQPYYRDPLVYFTPANEIQEERRLFDGRYFVPA